MKEKIIKEICSAAGTIALIVMLTMSFGIIPPLGNFLNPFGVWTVPNNAKYTDMTIKDCQLNDTVTVQFDEFGIPHIYAATDHDLFFAVGYLHAANRLFEMDLFRRASAGRLAEILGVDLVDTDKYFRILGFNRHAQLGLAYMQENETAQYALLQSYANGVNKYIGSLTPWTMPLEYKLLSITPEPWTVYDTVVFKYLQAWDLSGDLSDLDNTLLMQKLPDLIYAELYPNWSKGDPFVPPIIQEFKKLDTESSPLINTIQGIQGLENKRLHLFGALAEGIGSNNWAVNGSKTDNGMPLLAGDPHLNYQLPSLWYEIHAISDQGYNCTGVTFPAAPVILIGHNDHVAWSLTNIGGDSHVDFYEETMNATHYYFDGAWRPLKIHNEVIKVKGGSNIPVTVRETVHGPLITDHDIVTNITETGFPTPKVNISLKWTSTHITPGENYSNEFLGLYLMNKAVNFSTFNEGLRWFGGMQNIVYADIYGTIAMTVTGPFPIRKQGVDGLANGTLKGNVIQNGTGSGEEWDSFIPFNELPREVNPSRRWVASSNQFSINGKYSYYIGENTFDDGWRARRISDLMESSDSLTVEDFKEFQLDNYAYSASQFLPILLDVWNYSITVGKTYNQTVIEAMNYLFSWNASYEYDKTYIAPTIWAQWLSYYQQNTWDELNFYDAAGLRMPKVTILENLTKNQPTSKWFDDNSTLGIVETRNETMLKSLNQTIARLTASYGMISNWVWGDHHQIFVEHLTGIEALSSPRIPINGGSDTINNQWETGGPSWRMVVSLGGTSVAIYPGGQSGNPVSSHYLDLFYLYVDEEYHTVYRTDSFTPEAIWTFTV